MPRSRGSRLARKFPWVRTTPRGSAVVPEVKRTCAMWLRGMGWSAGDWWGGRGDSASREPGLLMVASVVRLTGAQPIVAVLLGGAARLAASGQSSRWSVAMEGPSGGLLLVVKAMRADVSRATRDANSTVAPSSNGTATAPSRRQDQKADIHSALLGPQRRTRSPVPTPFWRSSNVPANAMEHSF